MVGWAQVRMQYIVDRLDNEAALRVATQCVASWERIEQIRLADEKAYRRNAETLIGLASNPNPDIVAQYLQQVESDVVEIRATNPDPECDLGAAQRLLAGTSDGK